MDMELFKHLMSVHIGNIKHLLNLMPIKGDTPEDCQREFLLERLHSFEKAVNGVNEEDFKK